MLHPARLFAVLALCGGLSACATYDYGYPPSYYGYSGPYYGYTYDYGPYYYDYGPYYYGPRYYGYGGYYGAPSVGFDFRYRDGQYRSDRRATNNRGGGHRASRNSISTRPTNPTSTRPTVQRGSRGSVAANRSRVPAAPVARAEQ